MKTEMKSTEALTLLGICPNDYAWIDVRSEGENLDGFIPGFHSIPILNNQERVLVGTTYKKEGQQKAIELGHSLVRDSKNIRVDSWESLIKQSKTQTAIVNCWRGGLRSKTACEWLNERNIKSIRIEGGYKALRGELLEQLGQLPKLIVLSGLTGSGKTRLLNKYKSRALDLEFHAHHRGSTFGIQIRGEQPRQATFENKILFDLYQKRFELLIEDESIRIGQVQIPKILKEKMRASPVVWIDAELSERVEWIAQEYVIDLIKKGFESAEIMKKLEQSLLLLTKKLGYALTTELRRELIKAFETNPLDSLSHIAWIEPLLTCHYDKLYDYSFKKFPRTVIFKGKPKECEQWIQNKFDLPKP
ncbi:MAG: tRNA 2-selenouridine(34) synthase MnmH [Xanthomonadaceae bacterium]|nr:tRNA 2-selenouridine(34) synthase MnmH [Xanthomonadaceae bacterium]